MPTLNENIDLPPLRRSRRARSLRNPSQNDRQGGPTKSKYFDDCGTGSSSHDDVESDSSEEETHIYARKQDDTEDVEEEEEYAYLKQNKRKPAFSPQKAKKKAKSTAGGSGTAQEVFIPHCNPLEDSIDIEYKDDTIHPNTIAFLKDLAKNNHRPWFAEHEIRYRTAKQDFESFIAKLSQNIIEDIDTTIPELPLKDLVFRIYRDIRFSNDQTPYKIYFSAAWSRTGRKGPYAHYYLQIQPHGKSMVGGGIWHADAQPLALLRRAVSRKPGRLKKILATEGIARDLLSIQGDIDEQIAVDAFLSQNSDDALKTAPKGFPKNHPEIALLRLRSYAVGRRFSDEEVLKPGFFQQAVDLLSKIEPLITYLNSIVMPDMDMDTASESDTDV